MTTSLEGLKHKYDVTMTATLRPKIIEATLKSFTKNLLFPAKDFRLIVNIDPIGENIKQESIVDLCREYIPIVLARCPKNPSFANAVIWCWHMVETDYAFHLEDDWLLQRPVDLSKLVAILNSNRNLSSLRFSKYKLSNGSQFSLNQQIIYDYTGKNYYICRLCDQFSLNPTLVKRTFMREALPFMTSDQNPEKQFRTRNSKMSKVMQRWMVALYGKPGDPALVVDNGLIWRKHNGFTKNGNQPEQFTTWISMN